jgi:hypothetical protein
MVEISEEMTYQEIVEKLVEGGIEGVKNANYKPEEEAAYIRGFEICRNLSTIGEFTTTLDERHKRELELMGPSYDAQEDYWPHRWETTQIEYVWEVLKVGMGLYPQSAQAAMRYGEMLAEKRGVDIG